jgi:hypothetical protein
MTDKKCQGEDKTEKGTSPCKESGRRVKYSLDGKAYCFKHYHQAKAKKAPKELKAKKGKKVKEHEDITVPQPEGFEAVKPTLIETEPKKSKK